MPAPDLALIKSWCGVFGPEYDAQLPIMVAAATRLASHECGVDYVAEPMPENVQQWCAAQVSYWINNPDAAAEKPLHKSPFIDGLLDPERRFVMELKQ